MANSDRPFFVTIVGVLIAVGFCLCIGLTIAVEIPLRLLLGWFFYLSETLPRISVSISGVLSAVVTFVLLLGGMCLLLRRVLPPANSSSAAEVGTSHSPFSLSLRATIAILLLFASGISLVGIVHQSVWLFSSTDQIVNGFSWEAARTSQAQDHLHNQVVGVHNYTDVSDRAFGRPYSPPGGTFSDDGVGQHGWMTTMLPFVEFGATYDMIDFSRPWNDPVNAAPFSERIFVYENPRLGRAGDELVKGQYGPAHFAANEWVMGPNRSLDIKDVPDGLSNTIISGEINTQIPAWGSPSNFRDPMRGLNRSNHGFGTNLSKGGVMFGMGDGKVTFINQNIDPKVLRALSTPDGGDDASGGW